MTQVSRIHSIPHPAMLNNFHDKTDIVDAGGDDHAKTFHKKVVLLGLCKFQILQNKMLKGI